tara:strand:+ start:3122 stop:3313 length:192 start_codon:yes stop_codon:yes gene_type:complete
MFDLSVYIEDEDYCEFIAYNFSEIDEFVSYLNKKGFTKPHISKLFTNYREFLEQFRQFAKYQE